MLLLIFYCISGFVYYYRINTYIVEDKSQLYGETVKIFGFKYFYLDSLNDKQINKILENKFSIQISYKELDKFRVFLDIGLKSLFNL